MSPLSALRWFVSYAAFVGAGVCLWQAQAFWEQQSQSLRSSPDAWKDMLRHHLVVVDAGHGGTDGGTQGFGVLEKKCSLDIATHLEKRLRAQGIRTLMTRQDDQYVELTERSALANRNGASVFVSIHLNADATSADTAGVETYFCARKRLGDLGRLRDRFEIEPGRAFKDGRSEWLARSVQRAVCAATGASDRRARDSNYLVVMQSECPSVLVECGYLSNETESTKLATTGYQEKVATAIAESVKHFLLATSLNPRRGIVMDPLIDALATETTREGNP
jgi:N-acetylmuramoyl-L-alanine amidase